MQEAERDIGAAPRGAARRAWPPLTPGNNLPSSLCNNQPESKKKKASRMGRKTETVGSINTVIQLSITAYMNLVWVCVMGRMGEDGGGVFIQHGGALAVAANMEMRRTASEVRYVCDLSGKQSTKNLCQSINLEAVLQTHTHLLTPPSQKRLSAFTSAKRLQPPRILKGHFYLKMPPRELTSLFMGKMDRF